jgi:hypothetical protein
MAARNLASSEALEKREENKRRDIVAKFKIYPESKLSCGSAKI